jgi:[ribosomal protein S5]-alanine N-acetyltransferase
MGITRLVTPDDAAELAALLTRNRAHLAPWDPAREPEFFTTAGQYRLLAEAVEEYQRGRLLPLGIVGPDGGLIGRINLNNIIRGAFRSAIVGYWVDREHTGRGVAGAALAEVAGIAFTELGLHRLEAGTLRHNLASQKVLQRNGFIQFGLAPRYLRIAGEWQDHLLFQRLAPEPGDDH